MRLPTIVVEIDLPRCANTYGTAPCTAAVGVTGDQKCFNTRRTCQDTPNYVDSTQVLRLCQDTDPLAHPDALPSLQAVGITSGVIDPGKSIGTRGTAKVGVFDHPHNDVGFDPYHDERAYDPVDQGTLWGKLRARYPSFEGYALRVLRGELGEDLATFTTDHYVITSAMMDPDGVDIQAKDLLALTDATKAQAPVVSLGRTQAALTALSDTITLIPAGVGNADYPASGVVCLSGKELCDFTRSGDTITLTNRGQYGTGAGGVPGAGQTHNADGIVQVALVVTPSSVADIIYNLLVNYTPGVEASYCDLDAWNEEADLYIGHLYEAIIPMPTAVNVLLNELLEQAGCSLWWDTRNQVVKFQTLRPVSPSAVLFNEDRILENSLKTKDQPSLRASQVWTHYGLNNPTTKLDKDATFAASLISVADTSEDYPLPAIRKVFSRWIAITNRPAAERLNDMIKARFKDAPRQVGFSLFASDPDIPNMGDGIRVEGAPFQDATGAREVRPFYVTGVTPSQDTYLIEGQEFLLNEDSVPTDNRNVFIDVDTFNINLRDLYDSLFSSVPPAATITFTVAPGAWVGGAIDSGISLNVGTWPGDTVLNLVIGTATNPDSRVEGAGGYGQTYFDMTESDGPTPGGTAIYTRRPINIDNRGTIAGGGGGGEARVDPASYSSTEGPIIYGIISSPGGGGAGFNKREAGVRIGGEPGAAVSASGTPVTAGQQGTPDAGGAGGNSTYGPGGAGGDPGEGGHAITGAPNFSAAGVAIDGVSYVTFINVGTILGAQVN